MSARTKWSTALGKKKQNSRPVAKRAAAVAAVAAAQENSAYL